ncbi:hypothetical protein FACS189465_1440 [Clostridia bacterium]|nr:hypothetical protein FACS189465_1440 [Clostridia bacterium]
MLKLALVCGGSSLERGISLNSARSVFDHLNLPESISITIIYYDELLVPYVVSEKFLYSNTPSDFDFKLDAPEFKNEIKKLSKAELIRLLKSLDIVFSVIHGYFGEDGKLQKFLSENAIPFVGSNASTCELIYNKVNSKQLCKQNNFFRVKQLPISKAEFENNDFTRIENFIAQNHLKKIIVKPTESGSSLFVYKADDINDVINALKKIFTSYFNEAVLEEFCDGVEFTVIVLQNGNKPVALIPLEIEVDGVFTYGKKYTPTDDTHYHCPPRFPEDVIKKIMKDAEKLFLDSGAQDFIRIDGWYLNDGNIYFSDFNPISGMEQNSFLFQASSRAGLTHKDILTYILKNACKRYGISFVENSERNGLKEKINVVFGGTSTEKEVSISSGTNVWLKLLNSKKFMGIPYFVENEDVIWEIPYAFALSHNTSEIIRECYDAEKYINKLKTLSKIILKNLSLENKDISKILYKPTKISLKKFIDKSKNESAYVFLGLHGGFGENGIIQKRLEKAGVPFNGSLSETSRVCMDKFATGVVINSLGVQQVRSAAKIIFKIDDFNNFTESDYENYWREATLKLSTEKIIVKPQTDGCSAGVAKLISYKDLKVYINLIKNISITDKENKNFFQIPINKNQNFLFEEFIETDKIFIKNKEIHRQIKTSWIELTVGVIEKGGIYHSFNPSITVVEGDVLSLEEKFQGGTGVNITPPDEKIILNSNEATAFIKRNIEIVAKALKIKNYARIDIFYNTLKKELIIIEANTLPALTPSTVFFQQAGKETPSLTPIEVIEKIIENSK